jgi:hypothetical protein
MCEFQELGLTYNQNEYTNFFKYPNPQAVHENADDEAKDTF